MKNFIVYCHNTKKIFDQPEARELFLQRLNDLMREDLLQHVYQSESQDQIWMVLNMEDIETLKMVLLPMSLEWDFELEIVPLRRKSEKL
jgi:hypothetical protein